MSPADLLWCYRINEMLFLYGFFCFLMVKCRQKFYSDLKEIFNEIQTMY